ncbi:MAG: aldose 1-epimerase family protein [Flavobacteriaceae bacterium]
MKLENDDILIEVKCIGAELTRIYSKSTKLDYLWEGDSNYWNRQSPVLFPIVGLLKDKKYIVDGVEYELPQHGFVRDSEFRIIQQKKDLVTFELLSTKETLKIYPYKFCLQISYRIDKNKLSVAYKVVNKDSKEILFSLGGHPGFRCPLVNGTSFEDYYLEFNEDEKPTQTFINRSLGLRKENTSKIDLGKVINLKYPLFDDDALIYEGLKSTEVSLLSSKHQHGVTFNFTDWKYLAFWTKGRDAPFICIEPWCGIADSEEGQNEFSEKLGIEKLVVGNTFDAEYSMEFF